MRHPDSVYRGERLTGPHGRQLGVKVTIDGRVLGAAKSRGLRDHSPSGFEWGYSGSGPAQLALAIVLDATGDRGLALDCYQDFKAAVVYCWGDRWEITARAVRAWVAQWRLRRRDRERQQREYDDLRADAAHVAAGEGGAA